MKKIILITFLSIVAFNLDAQNKFGHLDSQELLLLMPERKAAENSIADFAKTLEAQLSAMSAEYQQGLQEYQENEANYNDLVKKDKEAEILGLQQRIQTFQQDAQQSLAAKEQELLEPILSKARKAIEEVAKEGKYTYIFDKTGGTILYANESEDVLPLVKKKLGL